MEWRIGLAVLCACAFSLPAAAIASARVSEVPLVTFDHLFERTGNLGLSSVAPEIVQETIKFGELRGISSGLQKIVQSGMPGQTFLNNGPLLVPLWLARGGDMTSPLTADQVSRARRIMQQWIVMVSNLAPQAAAMIKPDAPGPGLKRFDAMRLALKQLKWALDLHQFDGVPARRLAPDPLAVTAVNVAEETHWMWKKGATPGQLTLAVSINGSVRVLGPPSEESPDGPIVRELDISPAKAVRKARWSHSGNVLAVLDKSTVVVLNIITGKKINAFKVPFMSRPIMAIDHFGNNLAIAQRLSKAARVYIIDGETTSPQYMAAEYPEPLSSIHFHHEILYGSRDQPSPATTSKFMQPVARGPLRPRP